MSREDLRFWLFALAMIFLFYGEPDVWDKLHAYVMSIEGCR